MRGDTPGGKIVTFYSYKGGTGRSMALANVAWILASNGQKVLAVDWDLEAPGLHRYFSPFLVDRELTASPGIIDFFLDYVLAAMTPPASGLPPANDWHLPYTNILRYAMSLDWDFPQDGRLDFIPAGRQGPAYSSRVNSFNWQDFYGRLGGKPFLEAVKERMRAEYDYVLIDSRTGVSDTSGICTVQMADMLVVCYTLNNQSAQGAVAVAASVRAQRPDLRIVPVPMRIENAEKEKSDSREVVARSWFSEIGIELAGRVKFPYIPYYAYEEILSAFGDAPGSTNTLLEAAQRLTAQITEGKIENLQVTAEPSRREEILAAYASGMALPKPLAKLRRPSRATRLRLLWLTFLRPVVVHPAAVALALILSLILVSEGSTVGQIRAGLSTPVITHGLVENLWFTNEGDLVIIEKEENQPLRVKKFTLAEQYPKMVSDVTVGVESFARACGRSTPPPASVYAISRDARKVALALPQGICIASLDSRKQEAMLKKERAEAVVSLAFAGMDSNTIGAVLENGRVEFYDVKQAKRRAAGTFLAEGWPLYSSSDVILAISWGTGDLVCFEFKAKLLARFVSAVPIVNSISAAAAGNCAKIAVGGGDGNVLMSHGENDQKLTVYFLAPGAVSSLAYSPDGKLFAGGDFPAIYLIEAEGVRPFINAPPGNRLMAVSERRLAFAGKGLTVVEIEYERRLTPRGVFFVCSFALLLSFVGLYAALYYRRRGSDAV